MDQQFQKLQIDSQGPKINSEWPNRFVHPIEKRNCSGVPDPYVGPLLPKVNSSSFFFSISLQRSELSRSNSYLNMSSLRAMLRQKLLLTSHHVTSRFVKVNLLNNKSTPMILRITMGKFIDMIKICLLSENFPLYGVKLNEIFIKNLYHMKYIS